MMHHHLHIIIAFFRLNISTQYGMCALSRCAIRVVQLLGMRKGSIFRSAVPAATYHASNAAALMLAVAGAISSSPSFCLGEPFDLTSCEAVQS